MDTRNIFIGGDRRATYMQVQWFRLSNDCHVLFEAIRMQLKRWWTWAAMQRLGCQINILDEEGMNEWQRKRRLGQLQTISLISTIHIHRICISTTWMALWPVDCRCRQTKPLQKAIRFNKNKKWQRICQNHISIQRERERDPYQSRTEDLFSSRVQFFEPKAKQ